MPRLASIRLQKESFEVIFNLVTGLDGTQLNALFMLDKKLSKEVYDEIGQLMVTKLADPPLDPRVASML